MEYLLALGIGGQEGLGSIVAWNDGIDFGQEMMDLLVLDLTSLGGERLDGNIAGQGSEAIETSLSNDGQQLVGGLRDVGSIIQFRRLLRIEQADLGEDLLDGGVVAEKGMASNPRGE